MLLVSYRYHHRRGPDCSMSFLLLCGLLPLVVCVMPVPNILEHEAFLFSLMYCIAVPNCAIPVLLPCDLRLLAWYPMLPRSILEPTFSGAMHYIHVPDCAMFCLFPRALLSPAE